MRAPGASAFRQHFRLSRAGRHGDWVIDSVRQDGIDSPNLVSFVAHPNARLRIRLERALSRRDGEEGRDAVPEREAPAGEASP